MSTLSDAIFNIVNQHSGGLKMTELCVKILEDDLADAEDLIDRIESAVMLHPKLEIIDYVMELGPTQARAKQFIYRKVL